jgi:hypothetical protein
MSDTNTTASYVILGMAMLLTLIITLTKKIKQIDSWCCSCIQSVQSPRNDNNNIDLESAIQAITLPPQDHREIERQNALPH